MKPTRIFVVIALLATIVGCQSRKDNSVPEHLLGVWKTSDSRYAGRVLEIKNKIIIIRKGEETIGLHPITATDQAQQGDSILYTFSHISDHGRRYTSSFYYEPTDEGTIRLKHKPRVVWMKARW